MVSEARGNADTVPLVSQRFRLEARLGAGGQGEAWKATDLEQGGPVVVKLLLPAHAASPRLVERFRREVLALATLRHPHVVELIAHGICEARGRPFYVMPWVDGEPLSAVLCREGRLPVPRTMRLIGQLADALVTAHAAGILHRDLKPENLLLEAPGTPGERVRVIDFGLAKHLGGGARTLEELTRGRVLGTPLYMAPEQAAGEPTGPASDIYAVGCLLMALLTGRPPFTEGDVIALLSQHVMAEPPPLDHRLPNAPAELVQLVADCLEKPTENRPDATGLRHALRRLEDPVGFATTCKVDPERREIGLLQGAASPGTAASPTLEVGGQLGDYPLQELLGRGGFGAVFRTIARDGSPAALKALLPSAQAAPIQARARFAREVRLLQALEHPAIPRLFDHDLRGPIPWALLELVTGEDLRELLSRQGRLPLLELVRILRQVLPALDAAHLRGVVHCDLKPENLRIGRDGRAYLLDFGIARLNPGAGLGGDSVVSLEGQVVGTLPYLAPELAGGRHLASPMSDVYALGCLAYELLSGRRPFQGKTMGELLRCHREEAPRPIKEVAPDVPAPVAEVLMGCLAKVPAARPTTAGQFLLLLEEALRAVARVGDPRENERTLVPGQEGRAAQRAIPSEQRTASGPPGQAVLRLPAAEAPTLPPVRLRPVELALGVLSGLERGRVIRLDPSREAWTIGRDPSCDVQLPPALTSISRRHAELRRTSGGKLELLDLTGGHVRASTDAVAAASTPATLELGAILALGQDLLLVVDHASALASPAAPDLWLRRLDRPGPSVPLSAVLVFGRGPQCGVLLDSRSDTMASEVHCRIAPRLGHVVVEDLGSRNGTWLDGQRVEVAVLQPGAELGLGGSGGPQVARYLVECPDRPRTAVVPGASPVPIGDAGDALRARLDVDLGGNSGRLFLFAGSRVRFGRNRARQRCTRENDLILRAFPRVPNEASSLVAGRTNRVSGHHGVLLLTRDGVAVQDDGSTHGTQLDGRAIPAGRAVALGERWILDVAGAVALRGRVFVVDDHAPHPVSALRLERTRDGEQHAYVWLVGAASVGSSPEDAISLPASAGVLPGHAKLLVRDRRFAIASSREDAPVTVDGTVLGPGIHAFLDGATEIRLGALILRFSLAVDDDMIPARG